MTIHWSYLFIYLFEVTLYSDEAVIGWSRDGWHVSMLRILHGLDFCFFVFFKTNKQTNKPHKVNVLQRSALLSLPPECWASLERNQFERAEQVWLLVLQHTRTTPVQLLQQQRQGHQSSVSPLLILFFDDAISFHKLTSCVLTVTLRSIYLLPRQSSDGMNQTNRSANMCYQCALIACWHLSLWMTGNIIQPRNSSYKTSCMQMTWEY